MIETAKEADTTLPGLERPEITLTASHLMLYSQAHNREGHQVEALKILMRIRPKNVSVIYSLFSINYLIDFIYIYLCVVH